jgi:DNA repair protein RadC
MTFPEIEISVTYKGTKKCDLKTIRHSQDLYDVLLLLYNKGSINWTEEVILLCLNRANKIIGYSRLSTGGITGTVMDPRVIFTTALNCAGTTSIIISHNHPSGGLQPSRADDLITEKIKNGGELIEITLLDHIIVTDEGYYSYADEHKL